MGRIDGDIDNTIAKTAACDPQPRYHEPERDRVMQAGRERMSLGGVERVFGVGRKTPLRWIEQRVANLPPVAEPLLPADAHDGLEMDALVTFVSEKFFKRWR